MDNKKFITGGIVGGIANFFLGWLVWGTLLMDFFKQNSNQASGVFRAEDQMIWWALVAGSLGIGFLISYVISKGGDHSVKAGTTTGAVTGFFLALALNMMIYAQVDLWNSSAMMVDLLASVIVSAIVGAIIGWVTGRTAVQPA